MKLVYKGNDRSQKLKYHIQTSAEVCMHKKLILMIYEPPCHLSPCPQYINEAITTPTEESVRREQYS